MFSNTIYPYLYICPPENFNLVFSSFQSPAGKISDVKRTLVSDRSRSPVDMDWRRSEGFYALCDNQKPTVTVLYNPQGSVYGGFASVGWKGSCIWSVDNAAFLFQLKFSGLRKCNKFPAKPGCKTVFSNPDHGPVFGSGGCDLHTFYSNVSCLNGCFKLDGNMNTFGKNFEAPGLQSADINNGTMDVIELEVYIVTGTSMCVLTNSEYWFRHNLCLTRRSVFRMKDSVNLAESLCKELGSYKCPVESNSGDVRILLLGPVGSGKSGFVNTVQSAFFRTAPAASASWKRRAKYYHTGLLLDFIQT
ncbi:hypothetical protein MAR_036058 [Mya arenaria]|uniref:TLDc domain-containing protein n=1 Tax=Mya arenaria TaxID=6604 RepID=A0ABY7EPH9_MYAAR|nr:hypothetical protein MAR_036058 [Mya arenaria]